MHLRPDLGAEIKRIREGHFGESQADFATRIGRKGTDQGLVSAWETGKKIPSDDDLVRIAKVAGVSVQSFYGEPPDTEDRERREKLIAAEWMRKLAEELVEEATGEARAADKAGETTEEVQDAREEGKGRQQGGASDPARQRPSNG